MPLRREGNASAEWDGKREQKQRQERIGGKLGTRLLGLALQERPAAGLGMEGRAWG